jgi:hypothetical protein
MGAFRAHSIPVEVPAIPADTTRAPGTSTRLLACPQAWARAPSARGVDRHPTGRAQWVTSGDPRRGTLMDRHNVDSRVVQVVASFRPRHHTPRLPALARCRRPTTFTTIDPSTHSQITIRERIGSKIPVVASTPSSMIWRIHGQTRPSVNTATGNSSTGTKDPSHPLARTTSKTHTQRWAGTRTTADSEIKAFPSVVVTHTNFPAWGCRECRALQDEEFLVVRVVVANSAHGTSC